MIQNKANVKMRVSILKWAQLNNKKTQSKYFLVTCDASLVSELQQNHVFIIKSIINFT